MLLSCYCVQYNVRHLSVVSHRVTRQYLNLLHQPVLLLVIRLGKLVDLNFVLSYFPHDLHQGGERKGVGRYFQPRLRETQCPQVKLHRRASWVSLRRKGQTTDLFLELLALLRGERVGLGDQRDDVDFLMQPLHELHVQGLQPGGRQKDAFNGLPLTSNLFTPTLWELNATVLELLKYWFVYF